MAYITWAEDIHVNVLDQYGAFTDVLKTVDESLKEAEEMWGKNNCPFCGYDGVTIRAEQVGKNILFYVKCVNCGCRTQGFNSSRWHGESARYHYFSPYVAACEALQAWNRRTE